MTAPLKIVVDARIMSPGTGGVTQVTLGLVNALGHLSDGPEEYIIVVNSNQQEEWLKPLIGPTQKIIVKAQRKKNHRGSLLNAGRRFIAGFTRKFQNVYPHHWPEPPISDGFYESLGADLVHFPHQHFILCALPTIYNPHDLQHVHFPHFFSARQLAWRDRIYRDGCRFANTVVVSSQWVKDDIFKNYQVNLDKIAVIPWGPPTQGYDEPSKHLLATVKSKYNLTENFVIYPAVTWPHKNHLRLLEAIAYLRDKYCLTLNLICTGALFEPFWPQIKEKIAEHKLETQVKFLGFVPDEELRFLYRLSQFLVMPTLFESDSSPIYEAWVESKPAICSNVTSLPIQVGDAALVFDPYSIESIGETMRLMSTDEKLRTELIKKGENRLKDFSWERTAKAYRAVYRRTSRRALTDEDRGLLGWDWMRNARISGNGDR